MYNIDKLIGKTVTIKLLTGVEIMAKLMSYVKEDKIIILEEPRTVVIMDNQIAAVPYQYTGPNTEITISLNHILSIVETLEKSATDYLKLLEDSKN